MNNTDNGHYDGIIPITPIAPVDSGQSTNQNINQNLGNVVSPTVNQPLTNQTVTPNIIQPQEQVSPQVVTPVSQPESIIPSVSGSNDVANSQNMGVISPQPVQQMSADSPIPSIISGVPNGVSQQNSIVSQQSLGNDSVISVAPGNIIPESKDNSSNIQSNISQPGLNIDGSNPFDIGIVGNNIPNQNNVNPTPITPISVNNNTNNLSDVSNIVPSNNLNNTPDIIPSQTTVSSSDDNIVSVGKYLLHIILFCIPVIGFIMLIVKALDKKDKNISNFAKAELILSIISVAIIVIISIISVMGMINVNSTVYDKYDTINTNYGY